MKKVLVVVTNIAKYQDVNINRATGLWLGEAVHFVDEIEKAGFEIDYVSPNGGYTPIDPHSLEDEAMLDLDWQYYQNHDFMNRLATTLTPEEINPNDYIAIYYTGGHGVIWDFPNNQKLQQIAYQIYQQGGIISSVCHGAAGILNIKDDKGNYLINDIAITGFSNSEEQEIQLDKLVPYMTEDELIKRGAKYKKANNWEPFAISDKRFVTGQNPVSSKEVAKKVLALLK